MAGLLDSFGDWAATPGGQGLLTAVAAGLAGARRGAPINSIGAGLMGGLQGYSQAQQQQLQQARESKQNEMLDLQLKQAQQGQADQDAIRGLAKQYYKAPAMTMDQVNAAPGQAGPTIQRAGLIPQTQGTFDTQGFVNGVMGVDPIKGMQLKASMAKETPFNKIDAKDFTPESVAKFAQTGAYGDLVPARKMELTPGGQVWNPYQATPGKTYQDPNKPFSLDENGGLVPNQGYQSYEISKAKAGAPSVSVKNDIKTGESLAGQIGPMVKDSYSAAQGAVQTADAANRVLQAVSNGNLISGPMAETRMTVAQLAGTLGIGGKDTQEQIANTRQAIRGLAEMTLQGRKQMTGQGAITESEGKLAERAMSGDISMTPAEIRQLANASRRAAQFTYEQHQSQLRNMQQDPALVGLSKFYGVAPFPAALGSPVKQDAAQPSVSNW